MDNTIDLTGPGNLAAAGARAHWGFVDLTKDDSSGAAPRAAAAAAANPAQRNSGVVINLVDSEPNSPVEQVPRRVRRARRGRDGGGGGVEEVPAAEAEVQRPAGVRQQEGPLGKRKEPEAPAVPTNCAICLDDEVPAPFMHTFSSCGHAFCLECLRGYVAGKVEERVFPVVCPLPDCKVPVPMIECGLVLTPEEQDVLGKMEAEAAIADVKLFCPNPKCSMLLVADEKQPDAPLDCPHCKKAICTNCNVLWHSGLSCQQWQALPAHLKSSEDAELLELAEKENWRRCPKCGHMVERTEGCSFIVCAGCRNCFCYGCGKELDPRNHYCTCRPQRDQWARPAAPAGLPAAPAALPGALPAHMGAMPALQGLQEQLQRMWEGLGYAVPGRGQQQHQHQQRGPAAAAGPAPARQHQRQGRQRQEEEDARRQQRRQEEEDARRQQRQQAQRQAEDARRHAQFQRQQYNEQQRRLAQQQRQAEENARRHARVVQQQQDLQRIQARLRRLQEEDAWRRAQQQQQHQHGGRGYRGQGAHGQQMRAEEEEVDQPPPRHRHGRQ